MGNLCGQEGLEQKQLMKSKLQLSKIIGKAFVQVLQGDILTEQASAILNAAHDPFSTQIFKPQYFQGSAIPKLITGVPIITPFYQNGIPYIIHLKIPLHYELSNQDNQIQAFVDAFELASSQNLECISFTQPPKDIAINQQKDLYAKILLSAFQFFIFNSSHSNINLLKIINLEQNTTNTYIKELLQIAVISAKQSFDAEQTNNDKEQQKKEIYQTNIETDIINNEQKQTIQSNHQLQQHSDNIILQQQNIQIENNQKDKQSINQLINNHNQNFQEQKQNKSDFDNSEKTEEDNVFIDV